ncbi:MAG: nitroreductase family protein [Bacteroides sp.]|nr:nitroreductase family protein [Bacteroides sp.]
MNKVKRLSIGMFVVLVVSGYLFADNRDNKQKEEKMDGKSTMEVIRQRSSIRSYMDQPVDKEILETLVWAGMAAPSAMNKQPWQFIIIDDAALLQELGEIPTSGMVKKAPAAILVCGDMQKAGEGWLQEYWIQDCSAASQNILLAVTHLGLGAVWTSVYPAPERIKKVSELLNLPEHIIPLNIIPVGYPSRDEQPKDKWKPENVRWNRW